MTRPKLLLAKDYDQAVLIAQQDALIITFRHDTNVCCIGKQLADLSVVTVIPTLSLTLITAKYNPLLEQHALFS